MNKLALIPFLVSAISLVADIDSNHDGRIDGQEKMALAVKGLNLIMQAFPSLLTKFKFEPEKTSLFITKLVDALNVIVK